MVAAVVLAAVAGWVADGAGSVSDGGMAGQAGAAGVGKAPTSIVDDVIKETPATPSGPAVPTGK